MFMTEYGFQVRLPADAQGLKLDDEYFFVVYKGIEQRIGIHEYKKIYRIPGLYEHIVSRTLKCVSPQVVSDLLTEQVVETGGSLTDLSILDFGAGVGLVGEILARKGVRSIVGLDLTTEAAIAAQRDYPGVYAKYYVEDVCNLSTAVRRELEDRRFNCLTCVGVLACGHVSADVFVQAYNLIDTGGWIAFNILKESFAGQASSGLSDLIHGISDSKIFEIKIIHEYRHRYLMNGRSVNNLAVIGRKSADI
jgi:hypothetical protein